MISRISDHRQSFTDAGLRTEGWAIWRVDNGAVERSYILSCYCWKVSKHPGSALLKSSDVVSTINVIAYFGKRDRFPIKVSLPDVAAVVPDERVLCCGLDALGHGHNSKVPG